MNQVGRAGVVALLALAAAGSAPAAAAVFSPDVPIQSLDRRGREAGQVQELRARVRVPSGYRIRELTGPLVLTAVAIAAGLSMSHALFG